MKRNHRSLKAWQQAMELVELVYNVAKTSPREETFGLASQMRRSAISVPANIAEGSARSGPRELLRFVSIAAASLSELDTYVEIAQRLGYMKAQSVVEKIDSVSALLMGLGASLKKKMA